MNSGPKIGIRDHLIAQKGDQRPQESTGEGGMKGQVAQSGHLKAEVGHIEGPGRDKCPIHKENVCFLERPGGEQLSMHGCMIARKMVACNLNERTQLICMILGGPGGPLEGPLHFIQQIKLRRRARISLRDHRWSLKRFAVRIYEANVQI